MYMGTAARDRPCPCCTTELIALCTLHTEWLARQFEKLELAACPHVCAVRLLLCCPVVGMRARCLVWKQEPDALRYLIYGHIEDCDRLNVVTSLTVTLTLSTAEL
jgi:hypothetical protein